MCCRRAQSRARRRVRPQRPHSSGTRAPARHAAPARPPCAPRAPSCTTHPKPRPPSHSSGARARARRAAPARPPCARRAQSWGAQQSGFRSGQESLLLRSAVRRQVNLRCLAYVAQRWRIDDARHRGEQPPCLATQRHITMRSLPFYLPIQCATTRNRVSPAAHPSVLPPSTTMTSRGGGNRLRRWRTHSAMHRASFSAWRALRRARQREPQGGRAAHGMPSSSCRHIMRATCMCTTCEGPIPDRTQGFRVLCTLALQPVGLLLVVLGCVGTG